MKKKKVKASGKAHKSDANIRNLSISCRMIQVDPADLEEDMTVWYTVNHNPHTGCGPFKVASAGGKIVLQNTSGVRFGIDKLKTRVQFFVPTRQTFKTPNNPFSVWGA